jgi:hypothetical protein
MSEELRQALDGVEFQAQREARLAEPRKNVRSFHRKVRALSLDAPCIASSIASVISSHRLPASGAVLYLCTLVARVAT